MKKKILLVVSAFVIAVACQPKASDNMQQDQEPKMDQPADSCDTQKGTGGCCGAENERPALEKAAVLPIVTPAPVKAEQTASVVSEEKAK